MIAHPARRRKADGEQKVCERVHAVGGARACARLHDSVIHVRGLHATAQSALPWRHAIRIATPAICARAREFKLTIRWRIRLCTTSTHSSLHHTSAASGFTAKAIDKIKFDRFSLRTAVTSFPHRQINGWDLNTDNLAKSRPSASQDSAPWDVESHDANHTARHCKGQGCCGS